MHAKMKKHIRVVKTLSRHLDGIETTVQLLQGALMVVVVVVMLKRSFVSLMAAVSSNRF